MACAGPQGSMSHESLTQLIVDIRDTMSERTQIFVDGEQSESDTKSSGGSKQKTIGGTVTLTGSHDTLNKLFVSDAATVLAVTQCVNASVKTPGNTEGQDNSLPTIREKESNRGSCSPSSELSRGAQADRSSIWKTHPWHTASNQAPSP